MSRKKKVEQPPAREPHVVCELRVVRVKTMHGEFFRLVELETTDGEITSSQFAHDYFQDPADIYDRANAIVAAMQLPILDMSCIHRKH
jgi:hypothetical protein